MHVEAEAAFRQQKQKSTNEWGNPLFIRSIKSWDPFAPMAKILWRFEFRVHNRHSRQDVPKHHFTINALCHVSANKSTPSLFAHVIRRQLLLLLLVNPKCFSSASWVGGLLMWGKFTTYSWREEHHLTGPHRPDAKLGRQACRRTSWSFRLGVRQYSSSRQGARLITLPDQISSPWGFPLSKEPISMRISITPPIITECSPDGNFLFYFWYY